MAAAPVASPLPRSSADPSGKRLIRRWRVFGPGTWKGEKYTANDIRELVDNFHRFRRPAHEGRPEAFWDPRLSIHHDDGTLGLCEGTVVDCGQDPDGWLWTSFTADERVAAAMDRGKFPAASIEWWDTRKAADRKFSGFPDRPDGSPAGRVLWRVSLMGAMPPAVKGMPRPPKSEPLPPGLDRFTDTAPVEGLSVEIPPMADAATDLDTQDPAAPAQPAAVPAPPAMTPEQFSDMIAKAVSAGTATLRAEIDDLKAARASEAKARDEQVKADADAAIARFCDAVRAERKATPAELDRLKAELDALPTPGLKQTTVATLNKTFGLTGQKAPRPGFQFSAAPSAGEPAGLAALAAATPENAPMIERIRQRYATAN